MLKDMIVDGTGKRVVRRVLSTDPLTVEVSFEDGGKYRNRLHGLWDRYGRN